ncbi:hypothetical protein CONCODRAFT_13416, partial [Conidiobolus coronatus NRRL 28638]
DNSKWTAKINRHELVKTHAEKRNKTYKVTKRIIHDNYNATSTANGITIWKINAPKVKRIKVKIDNGKYENYPEILLSAIFWGTISSGGPASKKLFEIKL